MNRLLRILFRHITSLQLGNPSLAGALDEGGGVHGGCQEFGCRCVFFAMVPSSNASPRDAISSFVSLPSSRPAFSPSTRVCCSSSTV